MGFVDFDEPYARLFSHGVMTTQLGRISKRKNPLAPDPLVEQYGADTVPLLPDVPRAVGHGRRMDGFRYQRHLTLDEPHLGLDAAGHRHASECRVGPRPRNGTCCGRRTPQRAGSPGTWAPSSSTRPSPR